MPCGADVEGGLAKGGIVAPAVVPGVADTEGGLEYCDAADVEVALKVVAAYGTPGRDIPLDLHGKRSKSGHSL